MRQRRFTAASAFTALAAACVLSLAGASGAEARQNSQQEAGAQDQGRNGKTQAADQKVCRLLPTSGTRMEKRVCMTREQWRQVEQSDER